MIIAKSRSSSTNWVTTHKSLGSNMQDNYLLLDQTNAKATSTGVWGGEPTSSQFFAGSGIFTTGVSYVAYLFAEVPGFSKFGSYTGNGSTDGPFAYCGFRPRYVLIKSISGTNAATSNWQILDTTRDPINAAGNFLSANLTSAEATLSAVDFVSNGFKHRSTNTSLNESSSTFIYAAFAESPFKYSRAR